MKCMLLPFRMPYLIANHYPSPYLLHMHNLTYSSRCEVVVSVLHCHLDGRARNF